MNGALADGSGFSCSISADGRIDQLDVGGRQQSYGAADRQYDDDRYRSARAEMDARSASEPQPAYPGGPLPGEADGSSVPPPPPRP